MSVSCPSLNPSDCVIYSLPRGSRAHSPTVSYFFCDSIYIWFFTPLQCYQLLVSLLCFSLCWPFSFLDDPFLQSATRVDHQETWKQHSRALCCLCMNWLTDVQWPVTTEVREVTWLVADHEAHRLFMEWFVEWRTSIKVCAFCAITHCQYTMVTYIWTVVGGQV